MAQLIFVEPLRRSSLRTVHSALSQFGLRPFVLLASSFAGVSTGLWVTQFVGSLPSAALSGKLWPAHETLFSFKLAVAMVCWLTTGRNFSDGLRLTGLRWALLAPMWLAGHVLLLTPLYWAAAWATWAFPLLTGTALAVSPWVARNRRQYLFVGLSVPTGAAELSVRRSQSGVGEWSARLGVQIAIALRDLAVPPRSCLAGQAG